MKLIFGGRILSWYSSARLNMVQSHPCLRHLCPLLIPRPSRVPIHCLAVIRDPRAATLQKVPPHAEVDPTMLHCHRWGVAVDHLQGLFRDNRPCRFPRIFGNVPNWVDPLSAFIPPKKTYLSKNHSIFPNFPAFYPKITVKMNTKICNKNFGIGTDVPPFRNFLKFCGNL